MTTLIESLILFILFQLILGSKDKKSLIGGSLIAKEAVKTIEATRSRIGRLSLPDLKFTLFQYQSCPFCCKVRALLDYYGISYDIIEVNPVLRQQTKFSTYRKVPILLVEDKNDSTSYLQLNDSSLIISVLTSFLLTTLTKESQRQTLKSILDYYQTLVILCTNTNLITQ